MTTVQFTEWLHSELDAVFNHDTTPEQVMLKVIPMMFEVQKALQQCNVSCRREQLIAFLMEIDECYGMHVQAKAEQCVDNYLKAINCS